MSVYYGELLLLLLLLLFFVAVAVVVVVVAVAVAVAVFFFFVDALSTLSQYGKVAVAVTTASALT